VEAIAKPDGGLGVRRRREGESAVARAGIGETRYELPRLAVHGDGHIGGFRPSGPHQQSRHEGIVSQAPTGSLAVLGRRMSTSACSPPLPLR